MFVLCVSIGRVKAARVVNGLGSLPCLSYVPLVELHSDELVAQSGVTQYAISDI